MNKNQILSPVTVEKLVFSGKGLARAEDGRAIMIAGGVIPGQVVSVRVLKTRKGHIEAQVLDVLTPSPLEQPLPEHFQVYGGCKWLPIRYEEQLRIKGEQVKECFSGLASRGFLDATTWHPIVASPEIYGYRNKLEFSFGKYISGKEGIHDEFRFGFHKQGEFDRIINCDFCVLASDSVNEIFQEVNRLSRASGIPTYDPKTAKGVWRHLVVRETKATGKKMLVYSLNTNDTEFDRGAFDKVWQELGKREDVATQVLFHNVGLADIVTGEAEILSGTGTIRETLLGKEFEIRPKSFFQTNTVGAEVLYGTVISLVKSSGGTLLDLYAGTGTIGILLSHLFERVCSVEIVADSSADAVVNARLNNVAQFEAIQAPVEKFLLDYIGQGKIADTLVIDPPRDGMHASAPENLLAFKAREMIYVSCNPSTLVRDLDLLLASGEYVLTDIVPVDMFPHTHHIETVARLERKAQ